MNPLDSQPVWGALLAFTGAITVSIVGLVGLLLTQRNQRIQANAEVDLYNKLPDRTEKDKLLQIINARIDSWHNRVFRRTKHGIQRRRLPFLRGLYLGWVIGVTIGFIALFVWMIGAIVEDKQQDTPPPVTVGESSPR